MLTTMAKVSLTPRSHFICSSCGGYNHRRMSGMYRLASVALLAVSMVSCGGAEKRGPIAKRSELMDRPAYQDGLADVLRSLPDDMTQYGVDWVRYTYDFAFHVGDLERMRDSEEMRRLTVGRGCMAALDAFPTTGQEQAEQDAAKCMDLTRDAMKIKGGSRGPEYSNAKLVVAEKGVEAGDRRTAEILNDVFEVGYGKGFSGGAMPDVFQAGKMGCQVIAERRRVEGGVKCSEIGAALQKEYLDSLGRFSESR